VKLTTKSTSSLGKGATNTNQWENKLDDSETQPVSKRFWKTNNEIRNNATSPAHEHGDKEQIEKIPLPLNGQQGPQSDEAATCVNAGHETMDIVHLCASLRTAINELSWSTLDQTNNRQQAQADLNHSLLGCDRCTRWWNHVWIGSVNKQVGNNTENDWVNNSNNSLRCFREIDGLLSRIPIKLKFHFFRAASFFVRSISAMRTLARSSTLSKKSFL